MIVIWKEPVVVSSEVLSRNLPGKTELNKKSSFRIVFAPAEIRTVDRCLAWKLGL
jgi:hypothetical protein